MDVSDASDMPAVYRITQLHAREDEANLSLEKKRRSKYYLAYEHVM